MVRLKNKEVIHFENVLNLCIWEYGIGGNSMIIVISEDILQNTASDILENRLGVIGLSRKQLTFMSKRSRFTIFV